MNDQGFFKIYSFNSKINQEGDIEFPIEELKLLAKKGFKEIKVCIYSNSAEVPDDFRFDEIHFEKIRITQSLPDNIVKGFLLSKGTMTEGDFRSVLY